MLRRLTPISIFRDGSRRWWWIVSR